MPDKVPTDFYELVDRFIDLANGLTRDHHTSRVSAVIMYAAARYNAHCMLALDPGARQDCATAADYLVKQYQSMLEENFESLRHSEELRWDA